MTMHDADDVVMRRLRTLRVHDADAARVDRVRARCHAALTERHAQAERRRRRRQFVVRVVEPALVGTLSAGYLLAMVFVLLRTYAIG